MVFRKSIINIPHTQSPISSRVTVSIGVTSTIPESSYDPQNLFLIADAALYQAKASDENQIKFLPE